MVWHSYMLNPRRFLEDCIRHGTTDFYVTGMPWALINSLINHQSFTYAPSEKSRQFFEMSTGLSWENVDESPVIKPECPRCRVSMNVRWTSLTRATDWLEKNPIGTGYSDKNFIARCTSCTFDVTHEILRVQKFRKDAILLIKDDVPMPGTILGLDGRLPLSYSQVPTNSHTNPTQENPMS